MANAKGNNMGNNMGNAKPWYNMGNNMGNAKPNNMGNNKQMPNLIIGVIT